MSSSTHPTDDTETPPTAYSNEELTQMLFDMKIRYAGHDKKLNSNQFDLEAFTRLQESTNRKIEESLALLIDASLHRKPQEPPDSGANSRRWRLPPSIVVPEAPRFNGDNATEWIGKIQRYYNHHYTPLQDRLYLTSYLFDHPASSWLTYWEDNCTHKTWDQFLMAVKHRFDPDLFVDHVGCLAELSQTASIEAYQTEFEDVLQKTANVGEETLISLFLFIAGLQDPMKHELLTKRPASLNETFALAQRSAACHKLSTATRSAHRPTWNTRDNRARPMPQAVTLTAPPLRHQQGTQPRPDIPVVRISAAERAERTRKRALLVLPGEIYTRTYLWHEVLCPDWCG